MTRKGETMRLNPGRKTCHVSATASLCLLLSTLSACSSGTPATSAAQPVSAADFTPAPWLSSAAAANPVKTVLPQGKAALAELVLRSSDLPASWKATSAQAQTSDSQENAQITKCAGGKDTSADEVAKVRSDDFSVQGLTVSSSATLFKSKADIDADIAQLKRPKIASCLKGLLVKELKTSLHAGSKLGTVSVVVHAGPHGAAPNVAGTLRATIAATVHSRKVMVYTDSVFITGPRTEVEVDYQGVGSPVSATMQTKLTAIIAKRCAH